MFFKCLMGLAAGLGLATAALAEERPVLTVYTYDAFTSEWSAGPQVEAAFEESCGCDLEFVALDSSLGMMSRLRLEGSGSAADVILGLDSNVMAEAKAAGLVQPHGLTPPALDLPIEWSDDSFLPFDFGYFAFVYDSEALAEPPSSLRDLVEAGPELKVLIQVPRSSTPGLGLLLWMRQVFGEEAPEAWAALSDQVVAVTKGWSEAYGLFLEGEAPMVLSYTTSPAYHRIVEGSERYKAAAFEEGHGLQVEVAAIGAHSDQVALAQDFLRFMLSEGFQELMPTAHWMYPAKTPEAGLPEGYGDLVAPSRALLLPPEEIAANKAAWVEEWLTVMSR